MTQTLNSLIVLTNLETLRSVGWHEAGDDPAEKEHLHEHSNQSLADNVTAVAEVATDQAGRFNRGNHAAREEALSAGEPHNLETELERRALSRLAGGIEELLSSQGHPQWILAAPQTILARLERELSRPARGRLARSVAADLTKEPIPRLEKRFLSGR